MCSEWKPNISASISCILLKMKINIKASIRSIAFHPKKNELFIGLMNGEILKWEFTISKLTKLWKSAIEPGKHSLHAAVTSLRFSRTEKIHLLSTYASGEIDIFEENGENFEHIFHCLAHEAGTSSEDFGSLGKYAEIWSSAWKYDNINQLTTVSEDQTIRVWDFNNETKSKHLKEIFRAKDHSLAVTCVDWKKTKAFDGELIAACSDDRKISLYNPLKAFIKIADLSTEIIKDWHTLTYLDIEENGKRLACGTQNGYLVIWDLVEMKIIFMKKVQHGGIEGLRWRGNIIATCSSDCSVLLMKIN